MKTLAFTLLIFLCAGCADSHQLVKQQSAELKISVKDTVYISVPKDGGYGNKVYIGSGMNTATIIYSAFAKRIHTVNMGSTIQNFDEAITTARADNKRFLVFPTILHWEDRATEWSAIPDKVEVKIEVVDTQSGNTISSGIISGKSGLATFGGDHPQDLLPASVDEYVGSLY